MNRASLSSSNADEVSLDFHRRARCQSSFDLNLHGRSARASVLPSAVLPYLRRLDIGDAMGAPQKPPLLVLKLSSPSFLDAEVKDDLSSTPLYFISTQGTYTTVIRTDPWNGQTRTADIEWPVVVPSKGKGKSSDSVMLQMGTGRRKPADTFLRPGSMLSSPRKFKIPGYSHALKWKAVGSTYYCLSTSAKGPIAVLEPAVESVPPRLKVFETLHDKYDVRPMLEHQGVSILLLDYLLVSSLLLLTDVQDWSVVPKYSATSSLISPSGERGDGPLYSAPPASTSASQWRKIIYGEPLFPKRASSLSTHASTSTANRGLTASNKTAIKVHGDSIYPLRTPSPDFSLSGSESDSEPETEAEEAVGVSVKPCSTPSRAPSPSAESIAYPLTVTSAPSHTYLDPSFYNDHDIPPVPPLPMQYSSSASGSSRGHSPSLPSASSSRRPRELPRPPQSSSHRSRSSPPRPRSTAGSVVSSPVESITSSFSPDRRRPSIDSVMYRSDSVVSRSLPRPPLSEGSSPPALRHSQSTTRPLNARGREKWTAQYSQRTLPPTPVAGVNPEWQTALRIRKRSHHDLSQWFSGDHEPSGHIRGHSVYDVDSPPPPYNTIDFTAGMDMTLSASETPPPPLPPLHDL